MKKNLLLPAALLLLAAALTTQLAHAQFGFSVVYDPTNYHNAVLRYIQLQQQLAQLRLMYAQIRQQYDFAVHMAEYIHNMPARYRAEFSRWRNLTAHDVYGNVDRWLAGVNTGAAPVVLQGYERATIPLLEYDQNFLSRLTEAERHAVQATYASLELADGVNREAMANIGSIRAAAPTIEARISTLERDSFSDDPNMNTQLAVLNKTNAANLILLRTLQDTNKLQAAALEQQLLASKQQRDAMTTAINAEILRRQVTGQYNQRFLGGISDSLVNFKIE
jgi:hypothetical protein